MTPTVALIPAAGRGTRMLPASRVVPKALITVVDRPAIQYVVEEAVRAGAREIVLVVNKDASAWIKRHFLDGGHLPGLEGVEFKTVTQRQPHGLGHAVATAADVVGDRPFFCLLADNIVRPGFDVLGHLARAFDGRSVVALRELSEEFLERYGVVVPGSRLDDRVVEVHGAVEKPGVAAAPSNLGLIGRYLFAPDIFDILEDLPVGHGGEIQLTDAIAEAGRTGRCLGAVVEADLLDVGTPLGLLQASTELALVNPRFGDRYRTFLESLPALSGR